MFRTELYSTIKDAFSKTVQFGEVSSDPEDPIAGTYVRVGGGDSAEMVLSHTAISPERYIVSGFALWGSHREFGPNMGELAFIGELHNDRIEFAENGYGGQDHRVTLVFGDGRLEVIETGETHGANVTFNGVYLKER